MSGEDSRTKGKLFEQQVARFLEKHGWTPTLGRPFEGRVATRPHDCDIFAKKTEIQESVTAVFKGTIRNGCNLIGAEDICSSYDTTFAHYRSGEMMYDLWLTDYEVTPWDLNVELALNQRLRIDHSALKEDGIVIARGSYVGAMILDPPPNLRRVSLRLIGAEIIVPKNARTMS